MQTFLMRRMLVGLTVLGMFLTVSGCKSGLSSPSMNWLSWGKQKPSMTAIAGTTPQKPSSTVLPSPSATTAATAPNTSFASGPNKYPAYGSRPQTGAAGFYTGPYKTGQGKTPAPGAVAGTTYPSTPPSGAATNGYQSPYQAAGAQGGYRTADSRSQFNAPSPSTTPTGNLGAAPSASRPWNSQPSAPAGAYPSTPAPQPGFGASTPATYPQTGAALPSAGASQTWNAPPSSSLPASTPAAPAASNVGLSQSQGAYRPGSTARNAGALGTSSPAAPSTTGAFQLGSPSSPPSTSNYGGTFSYPTTGQ